MTCVEELYLAVLCCVLTQYLVLLKRLGGSNWAIAPVWVSNLRRPPGQARPGGYKQQLVTTEPPVVLLPVGGDCDTSLPSGGHQAVPEIFVNIISISIMLSVRVSDDFFYFQRSSYKDKSIILLKNYTFHYYIEDKNWGIRSWIPRPFLLYVPFVSPFPVFPLQNTSPIFWRGPGPGPGPPN